MTEKKKSPNSYRALFDAFEAARAEAAKHGIDLTAKFWFKPLRGPKKS